MGPWSWEMTKQRCPAGEKKKEVREGRGEMNAWMDWWTKQAQGLSHPSVSKKGHIHTHTANKLHVITLSSWSSYCLCTPNLFLQLLFLRYHLCGDQENASTPTVWMLCTLPAANSEQNLVLLSTENNSLSFCVMHICTFAMKSHIYEAVNLQKKPTIAI